MDALELGVCFSTSCTGFFSTSFTGCFFTSFSGCFGSGTFLVLREGHEEAQAEPHRGSKLI